MKSIIFGDNSIMETEYFISGGEVFFPHNWTHEEFWHISCYCHNMFDEQYNMNAEVTIEFLVDGRTVHEHKYTFKGGTDFHGNAKDEVRYAVDNYPRKAPYTRKVRITTEVEKEKD